MQILVTGHHGYIGSVMVRVLREAGHDITGLDTHLYDACTFGTEPASVPEIRKDVRDVTRSDLHGFEAIVHLAALSNDPLGCLNEACTLEINHGAGVRLARAARAAGVSRFVFASSCSLYGAAGDAILQEDAAFNPVTAYGRSKALVEADVSQLASGGFSPTFMRNATAYGVSPRLRADLVVNNLVGVAYTTGQIVMQSDGTPWRPLVHVEDISRAFLAVLEAPRELVHNQAFNIGSTDENYQVRELAAMVQAVMPACRITYLEGGGPDPRCYRVNCDKFRRAFPGFGTQWTVRRGVIEIYEAFMRHRLTAAAFSKFMRITRVQELISSGRLDAELRWRTPAVQELCLQASA